MTANRMILIFAGILVIGGLIALFFFGVRRPSEELSGNLSLWGVFDSQNTMNGVISAYQARQPKVQIRYTELNPGTYESDLVNALAGANPPDIFMIHNTWLPKHFNKIIPLNKMTLDNLRKLYPTVVEQDFAPDGVVYALPLYIDTLAAFYNQDTFDNKSIAVPPKTWKELEALVPTLRQLDNQGRVQKPAAAIGGSDKSINRASDLLTLLMLQSGTKMVSDDFSQATFASKEGDDAFGFYTKFADPSHPLYTWSNSLAYSLDSFASGDTAVMFNYSHQNAFLREKNPFLNYRVIPIFQPENRTQDVNFANYWGLAVSNKTRALEAAQDFILSVAGDPSISQVYLQSSGRPPALRSLINQYLNNPDLGVFAKQALTARSWPQPDNVAVENIFNGMIDSVLEGRLTVARSLEEGENKVSELLQRRR